MSYITGTIKKMVSVSYKWIKRAMLGVSAAIMGSVYAFAKFEAQMANVSTMLDTQTMQYMPQYSKAVKKMAVEFGEGTATLSKGLYDILSASIAPAKALDVLAVSAKAAKAGMTTTAVAADAITTILNAYRMSADDAGKVSDILFATVKRGKLTFEELANSVGKVAATASVAGLSFEEVSAAIATMTRSGLNAFLATTALRSIVVSFLKPMSSAKKAAKELGFEMSSSTLKTMGLTGVLMKLRDASAEQIAAIIPNTRGLAGFNAMVKNTADQIYDLNLMLNSAGLTQIAYEKMTKTLSFSLSRLKQSFVVLATGIGGTLAPAFKFLTDIVVESTGKAIEYLNKYKFEIMRWAAVVGTRINMVRGVIQNFIVGAYKNWPETWKWMKDVALNQLDEIWTMFNLGMDTAIDVALNSFIAFAKSLYVIFEKVFSDIGGNIWLWMKRGRERSKIYREEEKREMERLFVEQREKTGTGMMTPDEFKEAKKKAADYAAKKTLARRDEIRNKYPDVEIESWGNAINKIEDNIGKAAQYAKIKLGELRKEMVAIQEHYMGHTEKPKWMEDIYNNRMSEALKKEAELIKEINEMERKAGLTPTGGGPTRGATPGAGGGVAASLPGRELGFMGMQDAWREISMAINKNEADKNLLEVNKQQLVELQEMNAGYDEAGALL